MKIILSVVVVLLVTGCGLLPVPLSYLNYGLTAYDAYQIANDDTTITDAALSQTMGMDCQISNALNTKDVCQKVKR